MHITPYMLILTFFPAAYCINEFYYLIKDKKSLKRAMLFLAGLSPFLLGAITDVTTREILEISSLPFFSIMGCSKILTIVFGTIQ